MTIRAWFPTFVYDAALVRGGGASLRRRLLAECLALRDTDDAGRRWCRDHYPDGYTSYQSANRLHRASPTFAELEGHLRRHVHAFARALDLDLTGRRLEMTDCWANVMPRHAAHPLHLHPLSTISGTYYVQTPRSASGLQFEDPRLPALMAAPPRCADPRPANRTFVTYPVAAGRVILFESWLRHSVPAQRGAGERVSVSFNWNWF